MYLNAGLIVIWSLYCAFYYAELFNCPSISIHLARALVFAHDLPFLALRRWLIPVRAWNWSCVLTPIHIVLRAFCFMYCTCGCLLLVVVVFSSFLLSLALPHFSLHRFVATVVKKRLMCPHHLRSFPRATVHYTQIFSIYPEMANNWMLAALG